jgi:hypothetical protein
MRRGNWGQHPDKRGKWFRGPFLVGIDSPLLASSAASVAFPVLTLTNLLDTQGPPTGCDSPSSMASGRNRGNSVPPRVYCRHRTCNGSPQPATIRRHTHNGAHLLRETMNSLDQKLDPSRFARIHRSKIVSLAHIQELQTLDNREYVVKLSDGSQHRSSRTYADRIDRWLRTQ